MSYKEIAIKAARESGRILKENFNQTLKVIGKSTHDIVSGADYQSEKRFLR